MTNGKAKHKEDEQTNSAQLFSQADLLAHQEQEAQALVDMEAYGIKVITPTEDEQNALKDRVRAEVWPRLADDLGQDTIDEICEIYGVEL